jgi:hypothetical protein
MILGSGLVSGLVDGSLDDAGQLPSLRLCNDSVGTGVGTDPSGGINRQTASDILFDVVNFGGGQILKTGFDRD